MSKIAELTSNFDKHLPIKVRNFNQCLLQPYRSFYLLEDLLSTVGQEFLSSWACPTTRVCALPSFLVVLFQIGGRSPQDWWHCGARVFWPGDHLLQWHRGLHNHFSPQRTHWSRRPSEWPLHAVWCCSWKPWCLQGEEYLGMRIKPCLGQTLL